MTAIAPDELLERMDSLSPSKQREAERLLASLNDTEPHTAYQNDPIGWMVDVLEIPEHTIRWSLNDGYQAHEWDGTIDPLAAIAEGLANWEDVGVESGTGTGKSFEGACIVLWFLACWEGARVFTFAPKEDQLRLYIWAEIAKLWPKFSRHFPSAVRSDLRIRMDGTDNWAAFGYSVQVGADEEVATNAQGMHSPHLLLIYEETPGIHPAVMAAGANTCTAPHNLRLALGNPDNQLDTLHQFCVSPGVRHVRVSALDHPNVVTGSADVVPGAVSVERIEKAKVEPGENTPLYESRVRGVSPAQAVDALIKLEWLEKAAEKWEMLKAAGKLTIGRPAKGVDVANSENGDEAAIADGRGATLLSVRSFPCPNANLLGEQVVREAKDEGVPQEHVGVDPVGVGAGTVNEAARLNMIVRRLNGANRPVAKAEHAPDGSSYEWVSDANEFNNLRSQMHWQFREDARLGRLALPRLPKLFKQLTQVKYEKKGGKVCVEAKADLVKRTGKSPNDADAVIYWNWVRPRIVGEDRQPQNLTDKAPSFDYGRKKLVTAKDRFYGEERDVAPSRMTRRVQMPKARV